MESPAVLERQKSFAATINSKSQANFLTAAEVGIDVDKVVKDEKDEEELVKEGLAEDDGIVEWCEEESEYVAGPSMMGD